jgi:hypothetical protein
MTRARCSIRATARRESLVDQQPIAGVHRGVHVEHHQLLLGQLVGGQLVDESAAEERGEGEVVLVDLHHVGVSGHSPKAGTLRLGVPVHRRLTPQHLEHLVGDAWDVAVEVREVNVLESHERSFRVTSYSRTGFSLRHLES